MSITYLDNLRSKHKIAQDVYGEYAFGAHGIALRMGAVRLDA